MTPARVLEAITPSRIGGAEVFVADFCRALPSLGADVTLFVPKGRPFVEYASARGVESVNWKTCGKLDPVTVIRLARLIKNHNIEVIHTHLSTASLLGAFAAKLARARSVSHVHGLNSATSFRRSDRIIAVSEASKRFLTKQGLPESKIQVVHNGVDLSRFQPTSLEEAKRRQGFEVGKPVFGVFGRLSPEKGQRTAIEAVFLLKQMGIDARLFLAGDGVERADLHKAAEALGIGDQVKFAGFVQDVRELMSACDAVVVPSLKEGFGLAAVEAMALERPVIASRTGGLPEIVVPDQTGFLFTPADPDALSRALAELSSDSERAAAMGKLGRQRVQEHFDQQKQFRKVLEVLRGANAT
jgi:glycosyltransferase involved in cell wall biosynthesis